MTNPIKHLKSKWNLKSIGQVWIVLLVFACTGFTIMFIRKPLLTFIGLERPEKLGWYILYFIGILPLYQAILLFYGALLGQFRFFWEFEKRMVKRLLGIKKKETENP
ncbi:MAG: hypothetical protein FJZ75_03830 [Bacteroidetes bacterium]|nr:hypothetical protein [Bacteroidota bacterium]